MQASLSQLTPSYVSRTLVFVALISGRIGDWVPIGQVGRSGMNGWALLKMSGQMYERSNEETASSPLTTLLMARASSARRVLIAHVCKEGSGALDTKEVRQKRFAPVSLTPRSSSFPPPVEGDEALFKAMLPVTDVMAAGHHAAVMAGVHPGDTAIVIGDGAVGLCGTRASRRLGAGRILVLGHQPLRLELARMFGATDVVTTRGTEAISEVLELTKGGGYAVLECVGSEETLNLSVNVARPGGTVGFVGAPHGSGQVPMQRMFSKNIGLRGGLAPARAYLPELLNEVLEGRLDPSPILDLSVSLDEVAADYAAMDQRRAMKVLVRP
jgi:threonine dehydrogenase-like Zn-dependent dehydrogenase